MNLRHWLNGGRNVEAVDIEELMRPVPIAEKRRQAWRDAVGALFAAVAAGGFVLTLAYMMLVIYHHVILR